MAAKQQTHTFSVQVSRHGETTNAVSVSTAIDDAEVHAVTIAPAENGKMDSAGVRKALVTASREARVYATSNNVELSVTVNNLGAVKHYVIDPSGGVEQKPDTQPPTSPSAPPRQQLPTTPAALRHPTTSRTGTPSPRAMGGRPPRRATRPDTNSPRPSAATGTPPRPRPSWNPDAPHPIEPADDGETPPTPELSSKPKLVPVTDKTLRVKAHPASDGGSLKTAVHKFKALAKWKQALIVVLAVLVTFVGLRACTSGGGEYTAICVDQRTAMRQLDSGPCQDGKVVYYVWYYVENGEDIPEPNTEYSTAKGTFDKPTRGTITYS